MNIQLKAINRVEDWEGQREWRHWPRHVFLAIRSESAEMKSMLELRLRDEDEILSNSQGNLEASDALFSRYRGVLYFVAYRVLGDHNQAEDAVQRCFLSASCNALQFGSEGAFRSWLVRVLIDEALLILREREWVARILGIDQKPSYPIDSEFPE